MPSLEDLEGTINAGQLTLFEVIAAIVIVIIFVFLARFARRRIRSYLSEQEQVEGYVPALVSRVAGWCVLIVGVILALAVLGVDMAPVVLVLLLIGGLLLMSGKGILENFAAGLILQTRGPFHVGDRIEARGYVGTVRAINARAVVVDTGDRRTVHVPNTEVLENPIVNYTEHPSADPISRWVWHTTPTSPRHGVCWSTPPNRWTGYTVIHRRGHTSMPLVIPL